jgi:Putative peptidoglycan binding domain
MTTTLTFYDAAYPPAHPPKADGVAFYIGGNTPHVWTTAEIAAQRVRYRLPIYVRSNVAGASAAADVAEAVARLHFIGAPEGTLVAWDLEAAVSAVYIHDVFQKLKAAGYVLIVYGSQSAVLGNKSPNGLYWGADWTNVPHFARGNEMTQFVSFTAYDESVALASLPFWDTQAGSPHPSPAPSWEDKLMASLPAISAGSSGPIVKTVQGLCCARGHLTAIDGAFGPQTKLAVESVQKSAKIVTDGVVGPKTWAALITGTP